MHTEAGINDIAGSDTSGAQVIIVCARRWNRNTGGNFGIGGKIADAVDAGSNPVVAGVIDAVKRLTREQAIGG